MFKILLLLQLAIIPLKGYHHEGVRDTTQPYVVLHADESSTSAGALSYLKHTHKSYHYYIDRKGKVYQLVNPKFMANHAGWSFYRGKLHWNEFSIGVCFANSHQPYTEAQYKSGKLLMDKLRKQYPNIQIVTHHDIAKFRGKTDPENFDVSRLGVSDGR
jgi:N-acetyl-anhydromuramyl-L-alanine amidase AmpD